MVTQRLPNPPPTNDVSSPAWQDWFYKLMRRAAAGLTSFNSRTGPDITLTSTDVVGALGYTPASVIELPFAYGDASPSTIVSAPTGKVIYEVEIAITQTFDGVGAALKVGDGSVSDRLMKTTENDPTQVGSNKTAPAYSYGSATAVLLTITPGAGATQGRGVVFVRIQQ